MLTRYQILLKSSTGKTKTHELMVDGSPSPNTIIDAINQQMKEIARRSPTSADVTKYERIILHWDSHEINLTNPANTGQDTKSFYSPYTKDYEWTKKFLSDYYHTGEDLGKQDPDPKTPPIKDQTTTVDELGPSSGLQPMPGGDSLDFFSSAPDWDTRWKALMAKSQRLTDDDNRRHKIRKETFVTAPRPAAQALIDSKNPLEWPKLIYDVLVSSLNRLGKFIELLPEDIMATVQRAQINLQIVYMAIERIYLIIIQIHQIMVQSFAIASRLDWEKAAKMVNMWLAQQDKILKNGIETGVIDENGDPTGLEKWRTPVSTRPNDPEELKAWLAVSGLAHSPLIGQIIQDQMRFQILSEYMARTGVGIPDTMAWQRYILGNDVGVTVPIQEVADMAGQIPDWFMQHADKFREVSKQIHESQHKELEMMKK